METLHLDPFGIDTFGPWTTESLMYWYISLFLLTDPTSPQSAIQVNEEVLARSLAIVDETGRVIGGAFNETMPPFDVLPEFREDDPFQAQRAVRKSADPLEDVVTSPTGYLSDKDSGSTFQVIRLV